ncbi:MAG: lycopene cyclase family protein [Deltaproteobacteria bacterium]|nr:lycopene cyclase family protein [Myxococcales bacterium]MDP3213752.1 lycopene cyclase family protein [Deltaproteobacteria bacterium]
MSDGTVYDVVILGAGVAGLCLARALLDAGGPWSILLVDGARDEDDLRALSLWTSGPTPVDDLVRHQWTRLLVADGRGEPQVAQLVTHRYQTLFFADLQRAVKAALGADPRHRVVDGQAGALRTVADGVEVEVGAETLRARWAFDGRFRRTGFGDGSASPLWQHFHGLLVRSATDAFDPSTVVFLDFRSELPPGTAFVYLLPFNKREALVELVTLHPVDAEGVLRRYLTRVHGAGVVEVVDREGGVSPLTARRFDPFDGPRTRRIGIPAGRMKASTGYALTRILDDTAAIVRSLQTRGHPMVRPPGRRLYRLLDAVFLTLWARWPERMPTVFAALFTRVPADGVLRFLDERATIRDLATILARLPWAPFLRALLAWIIGSLTGRGPHPRGP